MFALLVATVIVDIGFLLVLAGLAVAIVMVARVASVVKAHLPGMSVEISEVNKAVNHVGAGEPKLIDQVRAIGKAQGELDAKVTARIDEIGAELIAVDQKLSSHMASATQELGLLNGHVDTIHRHLVTHLVPWDGTTERRQGATLGWDELEDQLLTPPPATV